MNSVPRVLSCIQDSPLLQQLLQCIHSGSMLACTIHCPWQSSMGSDDVLFIHILSDIAHYLSMFTYVNLLLPLRLPWKGVAPDEVYLA